MNRDADWYNANQSRPWPFDDSALLQDDTGEQISTTLLADLNLRFPSTLGLRAYVGALYAGPAAVSVLILSETGNLLATFSAAKSNVEAGRLYDLVPAAAGVGGWIVFGEGVINDNVNLRFSTPEQAFLLPQVARHYTKTPVRSAGRLASADSLTGLVALTAGNDIVLTKETLLINGQMRTAIVFNLENKQDDASRNLLDLYKGPCGGRPESGTCDDPAPIEVINTVNPDCCGTLFIELRGCAELSSVQNDTQGVILDCAFPLEAACVSPKRLPNSSGKLPNEYEDTCDPDYAETTTTSSTTTLATPFSPQDHVPDASLPWSESFDDQLAPEFMVVSGTFTIIAGGQISGEGLGGKIDIVIPDSPSVVTSTVVFEGPHGMTAGQKFVIANNSVAIYNNVHTVQSVIGPNMVVSDIPHTTDGLDGVWGHDAGGSLLNDGGSAFGSVETITKDPATTSTFVTFGEPHGLVDNDDFIIANSPVAGYNGTHTVTNVQSSTVVKTNKTYSADAFGGVYVTKNTGGGGAVSSTANDPGTGRVLVTFLTAHGLDSGDEFIVAGHSAGAYNVKHVVDVVVSPTVVLTDIPFTASGTNGLWFLVSGDAPLGYTYEGGTGGRNISLWTTGVPQEADWRAWFIEVETILTLNSGSIGVRHNGGIVLNYQGTDYTLVELNWDTTRNLRIWSVLGGAFSLSGSINLPTLNLDRRYRLRVKALPWAPGNDGAYIIAVVEGLDDTLLATLGPLRVPNYSPALGRVGMHTQQSPTTFEIFTVRDAGF